MIDSPVQIDMVNVTEETLNNLKEVNAVMSLLLEEGNNTLEDINDKDAVDLLSSLQNIKVRDGVLKYFTALPKDLRIDVLKTYTLHLDYAARNCVPVNLVADATGYLAALMVLQAAFKIEANESFESEEEIYKGFLSDAIRLGSEQGIVALLNTAVVKFGIPPTVFKDSIDAVTMEECVVAQ